MKGEMIVSIHLETPISVFGMQILFPSIIEGR